MRDGRKKALVGEDGLEEGGRGYGELYNASTEALLVGCVVM